MSRIEENIERIENYIDECKPAAFSSTKIVVNREEFEVMLDELRQSIPEEVEKYKKVINNQEAIITNARLQAEGVMNEANRMQSEMVSEHEIMQKAYSNAEKVIENANAQADAIVNKATAEAQQMQRSIMKYSDEMMGLLEKAIDDMMRNSKTKYDSFYSVLGQNLATVMENRAQLQDANSPERNSEQA